MDKKIKFYGLFNITEKQYLYAQSATGILLIAFWVWAIVGNFNDFLFGFGTVFLLIVTAGEIIETYVTLRKFKNKK
jgi:hypothetical protein